MDDCLENIATLFTSQLKIQTDANIGKSKSTRSKTRQLEPPPTEIFVPHNKKAKTSTTKKSQTEKMRELSVRDVAEEGTIINEVDKEDRGLYDGGYKTHGGIYEAGGIYKIGGI